MSDIHDFDKDIMNSFLKDSYKIFINMREHEHFKGQPDKAYDYFNFKEYYSFVAVFTSIFKLQFNYEWNVEQNHRVIQNYFNDDIQKNKSPYSFILYDILETNGYFGTSDNTNNNGFIKMIKMKN